METLVDILANFPIKKVDLSNCVCLHEKSILHVIQQFGKTIAELNLSSLQVTENVMVEIANHVPSLQRLILRKCNLTSEVVLTWAPKLWNRIGKNSISVPANLEELDLEGNPQLEDDTILALLKRLPKLQKANLKSCSITEEAIEAIKTMNPALELLHTAGDLGISHPLSVSSAY
mmetsp:Transcript_22099/g.30830  ORF Transcript_22099/g.30830 Transcript_22099/m.30830 type:complete len:175 (+) Transcript_22099:1-525(+)